MIGANQEIVIPDFVKEAKGRRLSSLDSIDLNNFLSINFVMKSDVDPESIGFFLILEEWTENGFSFRMNFTEPLLVSKGKIMDTI
jgi:hypothetical protein